jgi:hypothetical protein
MLRIVPIYPELLSIYADRGNVRVLAQRARWRDIDVEVAPLALGEDLDPARADAILIGGGQDRDQALVADALIAQARTATAKPATSEPDIDALIAQAEQNVRDEARISLGDLVEAVEYEQYATIGQQAVDELLHLLHWIERRWVGGGLARRHLVTVALDQFGREGVARFESLAQIREERAPAASIITGAETVWQQDGTVGRGFE